MHCNILTIGRNSEERNYFINNSQLPHSEVCRDLGVIVTSDLSSSQHVNDIVLKVII